MRTQALLTIARDAGFLLVGFGGVIFQQVTGNVNPWLLAVYTTMLGIPGALSVLQLRGTGKPATPPTPGSSQPSPSSPSSLP